MLAGRREALHRSPALRAALQGGARSLGVAGDGLAAGSCRRISSAWIPSNPALISRKDDALLDGWIFAARDGAVDCVWRFGRKLVAGGLHVEHDAIADRYRNVLARLLA